MIIIGFNPRARVGRDLVVASMIRSGVKFQSTRPRGARRYMQEYDFDLDKFQSTRPRGARHD